MCAQLSTDVAKQRGRNLRLVDVNDPGEDRALVQQYVGVADVLPILLRSDGSRLEGEEAFTPRAVRRFMAVP